MTVVVTGEPDRETRSITTRHPRPRNHSYWFRGLTHSTSHEGVG